MHAGAVQEVIGVAGNVRDNGVEKPAPTAVYWPIFGEGMPGQFRVRRTVTYVVRSRADGTRDC